MYTGLSSHCPLYTEAPSLGYIFCLGEIYVRFVSSVYLLRVDEAVRGTLKRLLIRHRQRPWGDLEANDIGMIPTLEGEELPS